MIIGGKIMHTAVNCQQQTHAMLLIMLSVAIWLCGILDGILYELCVHSPVTETDWSVMSYWEHWSADHVSFFVDGCTLKTKKMVTSIMANFSHVIHTLTLRHCCQVAFLLMMLFVFMRLHSLPPYLHFNTQQGPYATWLYLMTPIDTIHYSLLPASLSLQNHIMFSAYSCYTFALQARTDLTLPWPIVDNAVEKCRVCTCFRGKTENPSFLLSIQKDLNWFWIIA